MSIVDTDLNTPTLRIAPSDIDSPGGSADAEGEVEDLVEVVAYQYDDDDDEVLEPGTLSYP